MLLHQIFEEQARLTPNALAVKSGSCEFTYQNIEDSANKVAHYLIAKGVKPGDLVAIYFKRSELPIVAMLGILKAGAAYVPIDRSFPVDRIRHIVKDAEIKIILSETGLFSELDVDACLLDINSPELNDLSLERGAKTKFRLRMMIWLISFIHPDQPVVPRVSWHNTTMLSISSILLSKSAGSIPKIVFTMVLHTVLMARLRKFGWLFHVGHHLLLQMMR